MESSLPPGFQAVQRIGEIDKRGDALEPNFGQRDAVIGAAEQ